MIYAFDVGLNTPLVNGLKANYGVSKLPTLVVNEKTVLAGYKTKEEVQRLLKR